MPFLPKTKAELHPSFVDNSATTASKKSRTKKNGRTVGKEKLARLLASRLKVSIHQATQFIEAYVRVTAAILAAGDRLSLREFGTLEVRQHAARNNRHPRTGKITVLPAQRTVAFKAGQRLKKAVDKI